MHFFKIIIGFLLLALIGEACFINNRKLKKDSGYNFNHPNKVLILPVNLHEISGIAVLDSSTIACVQDEDGFLYTYNLQNNDISNQVTFTFDGDFEGITRIDSNLYVLRSDGNIFEISHLNSRSVNTQEYISSMPTNEYEGLCFDKSKDRILISSKEEILTSSEYFGKRLIYSFDLKSKKFSDNPEIIIDLDSIKTFMSINKIDLPFEFKKNKFPSLPELKMQISDIAIHPVTNKLFILSAADHSLCIFSLEGRIEHMEILDPLLFNQAEGISFFENGDMAISNEGNGGEPSLLLFKYN
jgi:uncharacterized protein YjiK